MNRMRGVPGEGILLLLLLAGCSSAYRDGQESWRRGDAGDFAVRTLAAAEADPSVPTGRSAELEEGMRKAHEELRSRVDGWKRRDLEGRAYAGFRALEGESGRARIAEFAASDLLERVVSAGAPLPDLWLAAVASNPGIRAAHAEWRATLEAHEQAGYLEDLLLQYRSFTRTLETGLGDEMHRGPVSAVFPFPATVTLKGELADRKSAVAWEAYRARIRDVLAGVGDVHYRLEWLERAIAVTQESRGLLAHMERVARTRYQAGAIGQIDVLRIQSELSRLDDDLTTLEQERVTGRARLNSLLGRLPDAPLGTVVPYELVDPEPSLERVLDAALACRQEVTAARLEVEIAGLAIDLAETMVYPPASTGASLAQTGMGLDAGADRSGAIFPQTPVPEPRFGYGRDAAWLNELRRSREAARSNEAALQDRVRFEAKEAHFALDIARRRTRLFDSALVPQAEQALGAARSGYETGKVSFLDFIEAQRTDLEARLGQLEARRALKQGINRLLEVVGCNAAG